MNTVFSQLPQALLAWYAISHRDLPWRSTSDPYRIWVSEVMLQQTRAETVCGYYTRFLQELPTVYDLAGADEERLRKLWEGLGYYSRVRNLQRAAQTVVRDYAGVFPTEYAQLRALPGIGDYTAGAICSIAFNKPVPAVDGNVLRVAARLTADDTPIDRNTFKAGVRQALADVFPKQAGLFTQALMELGATLCGPNHAPECDLCPCRGFCEGHLRGIERELPVRQPKKPRRTEMRTVFILSCGGKLALHKRESKGLLAGLWEFPNAEGKLSLPQALKQVEKYGLKTKDITKQVERKHIFTHITWDMCGIYLEVADTGGGFTWADANSIESVYALPTAFRIFLE